MLKTGFVHELKLLIFPCYVQFSLHFEECKCVKEYKMKSL